MGLIKSIFGSGKNPADAAQPFLDKIPGMAKEYFNPYITAGTESRNVAQPQYNKMAQNPMQFLNEIMRGYEPSAGFNFRKEQAQKALASAAAAGGYRGTDFDVAQNIDLVNKIISEGQGEYLDQVLRILGAGLQGQENSINRGFGASGSLSDILANTLGSEATLAYKGQENKNASRGQWQNLIGQLVGALGGGALGGPAGASIGRTIGGSLGRGTQAAGDNSLQFGSNLYRKGMV